MDIHDFRKNITFCIEHENISDKNECNKEDIYSYNLTDPYNIYRNFIINYHNQQIDKDKYKNKIEKNIILYKLKYQILKKEGKTTTYNEMKDMIEKDELEILAEVREVRTEPTTTINKANLLLELIQKHNHKIAIRQRRNYIMRTIAKYKQEEKKRIIEERRRRLYDNNKIANKKMNTFDINTTVLNENLINDITRQQNSKPLITDTNKSPIIDTNIQPTPSVNLTEIVNSVCQEVLSGKITTIEKCIGKLSMEYKDKKSFKNKQQILLLNFEDDTTRPVLKIEDKYIIIIREWYQLCNLFIDIDETEVSVPALQECKYFLFQDMNSDKIDDYLHNYIPLAINVILTENAMKQYQSQYKIKKTTKPLEVEVNLLSNMGISIPENLSEKKESLLQQKNNGNFLSEMVTGKVVPEYIDNNGFLINDQANILDNLSVSAYNEEYNVLYHNLGENCLVIGEINENKLLDKKEVVNFILVLIHSKFLKTLTILNPSVDILHIISNHPEYGFIPLFQLKTNSTKIVDFIDREFHCVDFNNIDEINKKLVFTSEFIHFTNKDNQEKIITQDEENQVKTFLRATYIIDNNINNKMKASTLYDIITNTYLISIDNNKLAGFRTRLSKYLKNIGLQKKRYNDGFYYYGIQQKEKVNKNNQTIIMEQYKKKQAQDIDDINIKNEYIILSLL